MSPAKYVLIKNLTRGPLCRLNVDCAILGTVRLKLGRGVISMTS